MKKKQLRLFLILFTLTSSCSSATQKTQNVSFHLSGAEQQKINREFEFNLVNDFNKSLALLSKDPKKRSFEDSEFLRKILKRNSLRGFDCNPDFNKTLMDQYQVFLYYSGLDSLEQSGLITCPDVAYRSMKKNPKTQQMGFQNLFISQLIKETNNIIRLNEPTRSPSGLKFKILIELNLKSNLYFEEQCKSGSQEHCQAIVEYKEILKELKDSITKTKNKSPLFKRHWSTQLLDQFFNQLKI